MGHQMQLGSLEQWWLQLVSCIWLQTKTISKLRWEIELKIGFTHCIRCGEAFKHFLHSYGTKVEMKVRREDANETCFYWLQLA